MGVPWLRVLDTVGGLVQMGARLRSGASSPPADAPAGPGGALAPLEQRLAGVVVAALQEAFDRDRARMDLERSHIEAEQRRAAEALAAELRRQAAERALSQLRLISIIAVAVWMLSAALAVWLPGMRATIPRVLLGTGWACAFAALGATFAGWQRTSEWTADLSAAAAGGPPRSAAASAAPWLILGALALVAASVLAALSTSS
jgi:hypothetical protein